LPTLDEALAAAARGNKLTPEQISYASDYSAGT
jgi:hypothetical protein